MSAVEWVRWIGLSHLLQPPLTLLLASSRGLDLRRSLICQSPLATAVAQNMAFASVALPTTLGLLIALHPDSVFHSGAARELTVLLAIFWTWRLFRQVHALGPHWPRARRRLHALLLMIFVVQGPLLAGLLWWRG